MNNNITDNTSRSRVLKLLETRKGSFISGEEIASELGISRTAVWKAVRKIKQEGFQIDAVTNKGYRLAPESDILSADRIHDFINEIVSERIYDFTVNDDVAPIVGSNVFLLESLRIEVFDTVDSTNAFCMRKASEGDPGGLIVISGSQSRGRGRKGRSFFSPQGTGLYMSFLLRPYGISSERAVGLTTIAAVAVCEAIEAVSGKQAEIKWVNDIYADHHKVCGILTEASFNLEHSTLDYAVVGIGINVYEPEGGFPENIRDLAGAVSPASSEGPSGEVHDRIISRGGRNRIAAEVITRFYGYCISELNNTYSSDRSGRRYQDEYRKRCFVIGHEADVIKPGAFPVHAFVTGLDEECRLLVRYDDGTEEALNSGEISIKPYFEQ